MDNIIYILSFSLWAYLCQVGDTFSIKQHPALQVAFSNEILSIGCEIVLPSGAAELPVSSWLYHYSVYKSLSIKGDRIKNGSISLIISHDFSAQRESSMYYCQMEYKGEKKTGRGTYIHVRDSGYVEPSVDSSHTLRSWLIALCVLLLLSAISGTLLLLLHLYWKEQGKSFHLPTIFKINEKSPEPERLEEAEGNSASLYMSLHPHSEDVYHILDGSSSNAKTNVKTKPVIFKEKTEGVNEKTPVKLVTSGIQEKSHGVTETSPIKKTKSPGTPEKKQRGAEKSNLKQVKRPGFQEKTPKETEKPPIKLVTSGIQEKSHGVTETSPIKKTKSDGTPEKKQRGAEKSNLKQVKLPGFLEKTPRETEKHPIKLIPRGEVTDNSVYENLPS